MAAAVEFDLFCKGKGDVKSEDFRLDLNILQKPKSERNVHLYADPGTSNTNRPILYADCEGLQGGELLPGATRFTRNRRMPSALRGRVGKALASSIHIQWANSPETRKREYAVMELLLVE